jgi:hypothetical protein
MPTPRSRPEIAILTAKRGISKIGFSKNVSVKGGSAYSLYPSGRSAADFRQGARRRLDRAARLLFSPFGVDRMPARWLLLWSFFLFGSMPAASGGEPAATLLPGQGASACCPCFPSPSWS